MTRKTTVAFKRCYQKFNAYFDVVCAPATFHYGERRHSRNDHCAMGYMIGAPNTLVTEEKEAELGEASMGVCAGRCPQPDQQGYVLAR